MGCGPRSPGGWREGGGCGFSSWAGLGEGQGRRGHVEGVRSGAGQCPCALMNSTVAENLRTCVSTSQNTHQPLPAAWEAVTHHSFVTGEFIFGLSWAHVTELLPCAWPCARWRVSRRSVPRALWPFGAGLIFVVGPSWASQGVISGASPGSVTTKVSPDMLSVPWGAEWSPLESTGLQQWMQQSPCRLYGADSLWRGQRRKWLGWVAEGWQEGREEAPL